MEGEGGGSGGEGVLEGDQEAASGGGGFGIYRKKQGALGAEGEGVRAGGAVEEFWGNRFGEAGDGEDGDLILFRDGGQRGEDGARDGGVLGCVGVEMVGVAKEGGEGIDDEELDGGVLLQGGFDAGEGGAGGWG